MEKLQGIRSVPLNAQQRAMLVQRRNTLGLSQTELGRKAGVTKLSIVNIESGNHRPSPAILKKVCRILSLDCDVQISVRLRHGGKIADNRVISRVSKRMGKKRQPLKRN